MSRWGKPRSHKQTGERNRAHVMMKEPLLAQRRAIVIHSPHAGRSASFSHALTLLEHAGIEVVDVLPIAVVADAVTGGQQWKASGINLVVAAGGDGVVGSVVRLALDAHLPLGILPLGTANDLARSVGIPQGLASAVRVIASGTARVIDLGQAHPLLFDGLPTSHPSARPDQHRFF